jgi:hypothetical protein
MLYATNGAYLEPILPPLMTLLTIQFLEILVNAPGISHERE